MDWPEAFALATTVASVAGAVVLWRRFGPKACEHVWSRVGQIEVEGLNYLGQSGTVGLLLTLECTKCGEHKFKRLTAKS